MNERRKWSARITIVAVPDEPRAVDNVYSVSRVVGLLPGLIAGIIRRARAREFRYISGRLSHTGCRDICISGRLSHTGCRDIRADHFGLTRRLGISRKVYEHLVIHW